MNKKQMEQWIREDFGRLNRQIECDWEESKSVWNAISGLSSSITRVAEIQIVNVAVTIVLAVLLFIHLIT